MYALGKSPNFAPDKLIHQRLKQIEKWKSSRWKAPPTRISRRTLQRLRDEKRIRYAIIRGSCRYPPDEVERIIRENVIRASPERLEELRHNYLLRTGGKTDGT